MYLAYFDGTVAMANTSANTPRRRYSRQTTSVLVIVMKQCVFQIATGLTLNSTSYLKTYLYFILILKTDSVNHTSQSTFAVKYVSYVSPITSWVEALCVLLTFTVDCCVIAAVIPDSQKITGTFLFSLIVIVLVLFQLCKSTILQHFYLVYSLTIHIGMTTMQLYFL